MGGVGSVGVVVEAPVFDDHAGLEQAVGSDEPDQVWLTDLDRRRHTLHVPVERRLLGPHRRLRPRRTNDIALAVRALDNAVIGRRLPRHDRHSDRGSQFRSRAFVGRLKHYKMTGSMGLVGACGDNAMMESFFSLLQKNVLDRKRWPTRGRAHLADRELDRTDLPSTPTTTTTRPTHPRRVRTRLPTPGHSGLKLHSTPTVNQTGADPSSDASTSFTPAPPTGGHASTAPDRASPAARQLPADRAGAGGRLLRTGSAPRCRGQ